VARRSGRRLVPGLAAAAGLAVAVGVLPASASGGERWVIVGANTLSWVDGAGELAWFLGSIGADVIITVERRADDLPGMARVADNYSDDFKVSRQTAVFCREGLRCEGGVSALFGAPGCGMPVGVARVDGQLCTIGVHVPPPVSGCVEGRAAYVEAVTSHLDGGRVVDDWLGCEAGDPAVLVGDFNDVPGGAVYRAFRARGFGDALPWQAPRAGSWPAGGGYPPLPFFRLDHALPGDVATGGAKIIPVPGSDHRGVWLEVLKPRE